MPAILSIQSSVAYGHVGNSAAAFALMRLGIEVWPVNTVHFSNHTGYGSWRGPVLAADDVADVIRGVDDRGALARCDAVLSGYQGAAEMAATVLAAVELTKRRNPRAVYCCDPVMGDVGHGVYVAAGIPDLMREQVVPAADILTPNHFELDLLTGRPSRTLAEIRAGAEQLRAVGPETVLVTSMVHDRTRPGTVEMLAVDGRGAWRVTTPYIDRYYSGTGDLTSALFLATLLRGGGTDEALGATASSVYALLDATARADSEELLLAQAQDVLVTPPHIFPVEAL